jgi:tRNA dimethylallyltransferase
VTPARALAILGPTASGKSAVALALAQRLGGELVSCDSMQVYRGLDIGTAKPTAAERAAVPHHLVDILDLPEPWDAARFVTAADAAIRAILARGRWPILCGGTGLYAKVLLYGLPMQASDPGVAAALWQQYQAEGLAPLLAELAAVDPAAAARTRSNYRRVLRALEIVRLTGQPVPPTTAAAPPPYAGPQFVLMPSPELSARRIVARTHAMLAAGWLAEAARLVAQGLLHAPTAAQALGYPQIAAWLRGPRTDLAALTEELIIATRQYAKRQRTWFRHQHPGAIVLPVTATDTADSLAATILAHPAVIQAATGAAG